MNFEEFVHNFRQNGRQILDHLSNAQMEEFLTISENIYFNQSSDNGVYVLDKGNEMLTDSEYDIIRETLELKYGQSRGKIGAEIGQGSKVELPYYMPSMNKIKPDTNALKQWKAKFTGPYCLSAKLDGISALLVFGGDEPPHLFTRGNGAVGQNISYLLPILQNLPACVISASDNSNNSDEKQRTVVRGELILPKEIFDQKYAKQYSNPRNLAAGIVKDADERAVDLRLVVYEMIWPQMVPSKQLAELECLGFECVRWLKNESSINGQDLSNELLSSLLTEWRKTYKYQIDGIIVINDGICPIRPAQPMPGFAIRPAQPMPGFAATPIKTVENPEHAFAFKMVLSEQMAECKVVDVIWAASKNGLMKPRVQFEPVYLGGVKIEFATGFNAKFIQDNRIGVGAIITMVRSGDVIPHITSVVAPAIQTKMPPGFFVSGGDSPYEWTDSGVDLVLARPEMDENVMVKNITGFFVGLGVEGLSVGNTQRLFNAGYRSVPGILAMSVADFEKVDGFQRKMAVKLYEGIREKLARASLLDIMVASNKMGRGLGVKKLGAILEACPDILMGDNSTATLSEEKNRRVRSVKGIGQENATEFVSCIGEFVRFLHDCGIYEKMHVAPSVVISDLHYLKPTTAINPGADNSLYGRKIVMTKIRDTEIIRKLPEYGATLVDGMTKDVFALVVKTHGDKSNKTEYAEKHQIPVFTADEFKARFFNNC